MGRKATNRAIPTLDDNRPPGRVEPVLLPNGQSTLSVAASSFEGRWLGAGAMHSQDNMLPQMIYSLVSLCGAYPQLEVVLNHFDEPVPPEHRSDE